MDRYMNDTHSMYYNVDHSSMYGSNLSTVYADGPPPFDEDAEDDHGEFVFSAESNAIGEAVLNKIEGKLQRDAEKGRQVEANNFANFGTLEGDTEPGKPAKFVAFADFGSADTTSSETSGKSLNREVNIGSGVLSSSESNGPAGVKELNHISGSEGGEGDNKFGDFSSSTASDWGKFSGGVNHDDHEEKLGNGLEGHSDDKTIFKEPSSPDNSVEFGDFSKLHSETISSDETGLSKNECDQKEKVGPCNSLDKSDERNLEMGRSSEVSKFGSFSEICDEDDFGGFQGTTCDSGGHGGEGDKPGPAVIELDKMKQRDNSRDTEVENFTSFEAFNGNDNFAKFQDANDDFGNFSERLAFNEKSNTTDRRPHNTFLVNEGATGIESKTKNNDSVAAFQFPSSDNELNNFKETHCKAIGDATNTDNDFGDFSNFSGTSQNSSSDTTYVTAENESEFGEFSQNSGKDNTLRTKDDFGAFSDNSSTTGTTLSQSDFGEFSQNTNTNNTLDTENDFGSWTTKTKQSQSHFSKNTSSNNFQQTQDDFANFSWNSVSVSASIQNPNQGKMLERSVGKEKSSKSAKLVSLYESFPKTFMTLQYHLELLKDVKTNGSFRVSQGHMWRSLHSNSFEGVLRFSWDECSTADNMFLALNVTKDKLTAQPSVLAMTEGLEVPAFATGLGILQPSVIQTPPKKKKSKNKQTKEILTRAVSDSAALTSFMSLQQSGLVSAESKLESVKDNSSDTASVSDTASLDLDFLASTPSSVPPGTDRGSNSSLYNLEFAFGTSQSGSQPGYSTSQQQLENFPATKPVPGDPLKILQRLDTTKMSSTIVKETRAQLTPRAREFIEKLDDLSFMHSSVLMFPLHKSD